MRNRSKYRVRIYDEAHLIDRGGFRISWFRIMAVVLFLIALGVGIGMSVIWFSPIKQRLPGYMQTEQRSKTEDAYLKVDSLQELYEVHQEYLNYLLKALDSDRAPDEPDTVKSAWRLEPDSLSSASEIEREFVRRMQKAGYNTSVPEMPNEETNGE